MLVFWVVTRCGLAGRFLSPTIPIGHWLPFYPLTPGSPVCLPLYIPLTPVHSPQTFSIHPATTSELNTLEYHLTNHLSPSFLLPVFPLTLLPSLHIDGLVCFSSSPCYTPSLLLSYFSPQTTLFSPTYCHCFSQSLVLHSVCL
jgi:hypothetical protein